MRPKCQKCTSVESEHRNATAIGPGLYNGTGCTYCVRIIAMIRKIVIVLLTSLSAFCIALVPLSYCTSELRITTPESYNDDVPVLLVPVMILARPDKQNRNLPPQVCRLQAPVTGNLRMFLFAWRGHSTLFFASANAKAPSRRNSMHKQFGPFSFSTLQLPMWVSCGPGRPPLPEALEKRELERRRERDRWRDATLYYVCFPTWSAAVILGVFPAWAFVTGPLRRWRRRRKGLCVRCGYNLTGNVSGVCPECGNEVDSLDGQGKDDHA
jgi:hypothetical protein